MARKRVADYVADAEVTAEGNFADEIQVEGYLSPTTLAEMQLGAQMIARATAMLATEAIEEAEVVEDTPQEGEEQ